MAVLGVFEGSRMSPQPLETSAASIRMIPIRVVANVIIAAALYSLCG
jgi:hypothetical protein